MKNEFVPYEEAIALKELGFDEDVCGYFSKKKKLYIVSYEYGDVIKLLKAPTYSQAFKWFRDKYQYYYYIEPIWRDSKIRYEWCVDNTANSEKDWKEEQICKTYEEAELDCLRKLIEIVKENFD